MLQSVDQVEAPKVAKRLQEGEYPLQKLLDLHAGKGPTMLRLLITPNLAAEMLQRNVLNRPRRSPHVAKIAADMKVGRFRETHQGIAFTEDGDLIDGQHRLAAIINYGHPVKLRVFVNENRGNYPFLDLVARRTGGDALAIGGVADNLLVSSIGWDAWGDEADKFECAA